MYKKLLSVLLLIGVSLSLPAPLFADLSVSATIPPRTSDFQLAFDATDQQTNVPQNTLLTYQITYGAKQSAGLTTTMQLTADYSSDAIAGVDILDYVSQSASAGYGNSHPIVDPVNRKIRWTITLPNGVNDQTVSFTLKTNTNYTGNATVPLTVSIAAQNEYVNIGQISVSKDYSYDPTQVTPIPTPTPTSTQPTSSALTRTTATPTPTSRFITPTIIPTPTISASSLRVTDLNITGITQNTITVAATTNQPSSLALRYGTSSSALSLNLPADTLDMHHTFVIASLTPNTPYYLQVFAKGTTSDLLLVQTASALPKQTIQDQTVTLSSNGTLLSSSSNNGTTHQPTTTAVFTPAKNFEASFSLSQAVQVKSLTGIIKRESVLGINTFSSHNDDETIVPVIEKSPGIFSLKLTTPQATGMYSLFVRIYDANGNITQQHIADMRIVTPLRIVEKDTNQPIREARVLFYRLNYLSKRYLALPALDGNTRNPEFSDKNGVVDVLLPQGEYKADISAFGEAPQTVTFTIGQKIDDGFPLIALARDQFTIISPALYVKNSIIDTWSSAIIFIQLVSSSHRLFNLLAVYALCCFLLTFFLAFLKHKFYATQGGLVFCLIVCEILFESSIIATIILEGLFLFTFGWIALTFLILAISNLPLWIILVREKRQIKKH